MQTIINMFFVNITFAIYVQCTYDEHNFTDLIMYLAFTAYTCNGLSETQIICFKQKWICFQRICDRGGCPYNKINGFDFKTMWWRRLILIVLENFSHFLVSPFFGSSCFNLIQTDAPATPHMYQFFPTALLL